MIVQRTEIHIIKESNPVYNWILEECLRSRNLYNRVLYVYRQAFTGKHDNIPEFKDIINHDKFIASFALVNRLNEIKDIDFCSMMKKNGAQQIVFQVDRTMKSWFAALKSYKRDSSKFRGRPRIPSIKFVSMTKAEYKALETKSPSTIYHLTDVSMWAIGDQEIVTSNMPA